MFITVGTQLPFDRLVRTVDQWAGSANRKDIFAQIGPSAWVPRHVPWKRLISPDECRVRMQAASVVVAHAGMGTILGALQLGKPVLVMPRRAELGEQRNDHQVATARHLAAHKRVTVAMDETALLEQLARIQTLPAASPQTIGPYASPELIGAIRRFIAGQSETPAHAVVPRGRFQPLHCQSSGRTELEPPLALERR
jgi:UDP-N-acetylglucosamine transferase subunit ALG13